MNGNDGNGGDDTWKSFDWNSWGAESLDGHMADEGESNGRPFTRPGEAAAANDPDDVPAEGRWVTSGGVVQWEEPDDAPPPSPREEAISRWADDQVDLPLAAPDSSRVRSVRAWLIRRRLLENDAMGVLLIERRRIYGEAASEQRQTSVSDDNVLDLALVEHQATAEMYDELLGALDEFEAHNGPARVLVEFHLWLTEQLAMLATEPEAPLGFAPEVLRVSREPADATSAPTVRSHALWSGRADAALATRRRVEYVSAPEPEDD